MQKVAHMMTGEWQLMGVAMDIDMNTLEHIKHDYSTLKDRILLTFHKWFELHPDQATIDNLIECLEEIRRKDIADDIKKME